MPRFGGSLALLIVAGVVFYGFGRRNAAVDASTPRAILDRRYAAGDIAREQYEQMKQDLAT